MIRPLHRRLLVEPINLDDISEIIEVIEFDKFNLKSSGLESKSWTRGKVLAVGEDCDKNDGPSVGDIVMFTKNGGLPVEENGKDFLILSEKDLYFIERQQTNIVR